MAAKTNVATRGLTAPSLLNHHTRNEERCELKSTKNIGDLFEDLMAGYARDFRAAAYSHVTFIVSVNSLPSLNSAYIVTV